MKNRRRLLSYFLSIGMLFGGSVMAQNKLIVNADQGKTEISRHIYGHFAEHLGRCIYDGIWVGEDSQVRHYNGYRQDVLDALKNLEIPNLRWPGGCFADEYHWKDGVGPRDQRPPMHNTHWGGVIEDNSFGTHEFLEYCELIGAEPYIAGNVGSGTPQEMSEWVQYINHDADSPMGLLRKENGREEPWDVKYWGIGNENWGCGGNMRPEYYADLYRQFATFTKNYPGRPLYRIAGGANSWDTNWTEVLMKNIPLNLMEGLSLHYYTITGSWEKKGSATVFSEKEYHTTLRKALEVDKLLKSHIRIMDQYDPEKKVALILDEWGMWHDPEPGSTPGFLYQQNTLRDAFVAALSLNIFHRHADRLKMANLAQSVNVLQALVLTNDESLIYTPTYHVFDMYKGHKDAIHLPDYLESEMYEVDGQKLPSLNVSASKNASGEITLTIVNINPNKDIKLNTEIRGFDSKRVKGKILTATKTDAMNTFESPEQVKVKEYNGAKLNKGKLDVTVPAKSVLALTLSGD